MEQTLMQRLAEAIREERNAASLYYYYDGIYNTRKEYAETKDATDALIQEVGK